MRAFHRTPYDRLLREMRRMNDKLDRLSKDVDAILGYIEELKAHREDENWDGVDDVIAKLEGAMPAPAPEAPAEAPVEAPADVEPAPVEDAPAE